MGRVAGLDGGRPSPEQVREEVESLLLRVVTAGRVAEVLWRLMLTEQRARQPDPARPGGALVRLARQNARVAVAATVHGDRPEVYHAAVAAACRGGDPDLAVLVLAELACMHLRIGHPDDGRRLVDLAEASGRQLSVRTRRVLAEAGASAAGHATRQAGAHGVRAGNDNRGGQR